MGLTGQTGEGNDEVGLRAVKGAEVGSDAVKGVGRNDGGTSQQQSGLSACRIATQHDRLQHGFNAGAADT
jgi:hypothetical protein